jgi:hypothetical protein
MCRGYQHFVLEKYFEIKFLEETKWKNKKKFYRWATIEFLTLVKQICLFNYKNELTTICR